MFFQDFKKIADETGVLLKFGMGLFGDEGPLCLTAVARGTVMHLCVQIPRDSSDEVIMVGIEMLAHQAIEARRQIMNHSKMTKLFQGEITKLTAEIIASAVHTTASGEEMQIILPRESVKRLIEILQNNVTDSRCVVKAHPDEPIFTLRAQDITSDELVSAWGAQAASARGTG